MVIVSFNLVSETLEELSFLEQLNRKRSVSIDNVLKALVVAVLVQFEELFPMATFENGLNSDVRYNLSGICTRLRLHSGNKRLHFLTLLLDLLS